jgi:hypothetical protein
MISQNGKVTSRASKVESSLATSLEPSHEGLRFEVVESGAREISIGNAHIEVIPPKWNPFVEPVTHIYVKDNHLLTTFGGSEFLKDRAFFSRSVTGEAAIFFSSEENIAPRIAQEFESKKPVSKIDIFASSPTKAQGEDLVINSGEILATVLYLVPRYENRRKSLADVNLKLNSALETADLGVHITGLRQSALDVELSRLEELNKAAQQESAKKRNKKDPKVKDNIQEIPDQIDQTDKPLSLFEEEIKSKKKSLFSDETDAPDSDSGKKLW